FLEKKGFGQNIFFHKDNILRVNLWRVKFFFVFIPKNKCFLHLSLGIYLLKLFFDKFKTA
ncbi:MAG: hypothetical protein NC935_08215, partial [Candidatus Omnitrophica bacterium]|nr:hypothetical protein [Candidatus Omnitrophota bacterium]